MRADMFFTLLNQSYKLEAESRLQDIQVVSVPHMKSADGKKVVNSYKTAADDIIDRINTPSTDINKIKKILNG